MSDEWQVTDDRSHTVCFENVSFGKRITEEGVEAGIRVTFHEHIGALIHLTDDGGADVSMAVEEMWIHLHPTHAYDLMIGLLRVCDDAESEGAIDWSGYRWPLPPGRIIQAMMALAYEMYPDFDPDESNDPLEEEHNDPTNS